MSSRKPLIAGNWKMHGRRADLAEIAATMARVGPAARALDVVFCPPFPYLAEAAGLGVAPVGGQDCSPSGADAARTGEVSAAMLAECGASYVILGHSERRGLHGESSELVRAKAEAALAAGLAPIICVGETRAERDAGHAKAVVGAQIRASVPAGAPERVSLAYEPVWAIGAERPASETEIAEMHAAARAALAAQLGEEGAARARILYGGAVNSKNAGEIFAIEGVDGALVGRASLKSADFSALILAHPASSSH